MLLLFLLFVGLSYSELRVEAGADGVLNVRRNGELWLSSGPPQLHCEGLWQNFSSAASPTRTRGMDKLGEFLETNWLWTSQTHKSCSVVTSFREYPKLKDVVTFGARFPHAMANTSLGNSFGCVSNLLMSKFPTFFPEKKRLEWISPRFQWDTELSGGALPGGLYGGTPLMLYDQSLSGLILSPFDAFSAAWQVNMSFGLHGRIASVPANFSHRVICVETNGVRSGFRRWGDLMLGAYGKRRPMIRDDIANHLSYYTDTGQFYWYNPIGGNYENTLKQIVEASRLPLSSWLFDSWWYYKYPNSTVEMGGIKLWVARKDVIFSVVSFLFLFVFF